MKENSSLFREFSLNQGVTLGSCFGSVMFLVYISLLYTIIREHEVQVCGFANDHQLLMPFFTNISSVADSLQVLESYYEFVQLIIFDKYVTFDEQIVEFW